MKWLDSGAAFLYKAMRRSTSELATSVARHSATVSPGSRFLSGGRVSNIAGRPERIVIGAGCRIAGELLIFRHGGMIRLGDWCYIGEASRVWSASSVHIGNRVLISHNVNVHDCDSHALDAESRHLQFRAIATSGHPERMEGVNAKPIVIEDDVWIGFNSIVLKGSSIGARSVVAAGSIVTGNVPPDSLFIGTEVRRRLNAEDCRK
jgi:acetyltransferase-like isoleucine patch superfamily enzyme